MSRREDHIFIISVFCQPRQGTLEKRIPMAMIGVRRGVTLRLVFRGTHRPEFLAPLGVVVLLGEWRVREPS